jgi:cystathionine beta-lyase family protein involved in aluminum resistance
MTQLYDADIDRLIEACEKKLAARFEAIDKTALYNQRKVLTSMQHNKLAERHFTPSTGYGYNDDGRDACEKIFADTFGAQDALVRPGIVSGTHAVTLCLFGVLRPKDAMLSITSNPYDTIYTSINGLSAQGFGSLNDYNISYDRLDLLENGDIDTDRLPQKIKENTKVVFIQRSTGYDRRPALTINKIADAVRAIRDIKSDAVVIVDNCYGEFLEDKEPTDVGADMIAGSLIKNPGGGIVYAGGYIAGKYDYVKMAAARLTTPSIAFEVGVNYGMIRQYLQGLFLAPHVTACAIKGAVLTAELFTQLGYDVFPGPEDTRSDIIQGIVLNSREKMEAYCRGIQKASPVDSNVTPVFSPLPGYDEEIIMAAGSFVQSSSIELSADGPLKAPYTVYQQGGLTYEHIKIALRYVVEELQKI